MPPLIISKPPPGQIRSAAEKLIGGKRFLVVTREHYDTQSISREVIPMEPSTRPLMCVIDVDGEIDDILLRDIVQSVVGRKAAKRLSKPNVTLLYHEWNAMRAAYFKGQRHFGG
jgi:hypothetical protein